MKKIFLFLVFVLCCDFSFSQTTIYNLNGTETSPGVITFNWECDAISDGST